MSRKAGPDNIKIKKIRSILTEKPAGLWVREIARQTKLTKSTVSLYLEKYMRNEIEVVFVSDNKWIKIVRLRK